MPCLYDELFFHDNAEDCAWFHKEGMAKLAEETVQALCELVGVKYKAPVVKLYRVQVGAYSDQANAKAMQKKLKAAGFDAVIV